MNYLVQLAGQMVGAMFLTVGAWVMAVVAVDAQDVGAGVVGVALLGAGMALVKWTLKTSERVEATYVGAITAAEQRAANEKADAEHWRNLYENERELRLSMERAGLSNRRKPGRQE